VPAASDRHAQNVLVGQIWVMMLTISGIMLLFLNRFAQTLAGGWSG
jgi:hypothetical protein